MTDPTRDEMLTYLCGFWPYEAEQFDREEAIYWFANDYHGGQWSNLYSALSTSPYNPGPITNECEADSMSAMLYDELVAHYTR